MEKETKNKIAAINEAMNEELETLTSDMEFRIKRVVKLKDEILKILDSEVFEDTANQNNTNKRTGERFYEISK